MAVVLRMDYREQGQEQGDHTGGYCNHPRSRRWWLQSHLAAVLILKNGLILDVIQR